jgi:hypothetical protein
MHTFRHSQKEKEEKKVECGEERQTAGTSVVAF